MIWEIKRLLKFITIIEPKIDSDKLEGQKFCFTGSFSDPSRSDMQKLATQDGGKASSSVGKGVILVWDGEEVKNKYNKAIANGNEIISQEDFLNKLK